MIADVFPKPTWVDLRMTVEQNGQAIPEMMTPTEYCGACSECNAPVYRKINQTNVVYCFSCQHGKAFTMGTSGSALLQCFPIDLNFSPEVAFLFSDEEKNQRQRTQLKT